jgi:hypothetical protein
MRASDKRHTQSQADPLTASWTHDPAEAHSWRQTPLPAEWCAAPDYHEPEHAAWVAGEPFDDAAQAAMKRDVAVVVQDLAAEGKRIAQLARMFGLKPAEVRAMLVMRLS